MMFKLILMMVLHFVADFLMQSREMGQKKSSEPTWLARHLFIQWVVFAFCLSFVFGPATAIVFATANTVIHGIIDWNIWKLYKLSAYYRILKISAKKYGTWTQPPEQDINVKAEIAAWKYWEDHWFYSTIGFDQLLHCITILVLFKLIIL